MSAWSHLPNAAHIDRVIQSIKSHPESWCVPWDAAWGAAYDEAWDVTVQDKVRDAACGAARKAACGAVREAATWNAAWGAVQALIAYDAAAKYLDMPSDKLQVWAILSEDPAAVLLLPAVIAYEKIDELETV